MMMVSHALGRGHFLGLNRNRMFTQSSDNFFTTLQRLKTLKEMVKILFNFIEIKIE